MVFCLVSKKKKSRLPECRQVAGFGTVKENKLNYMLQSSSQHIKPTGNTNINLSEAFLSI